MQTVLEQGSIDKPLTFDVGLIQLSFIPVCSLLIHATFQSNCAEGLEHFSAFHFVGVSGHRFYAAPCLQYNNIMASLTKWCYYLLEAYLVTHVHSAQA